MAIRQTLILLIGGLFIPLSLRAVFPKQWSGSHRWQVNRFGWELPVSSARLEPKLNGPVSPSRTTVPIPLTVSLAGIPADTVRRAARELQLPIRIESNDAAAVVSVALTPLGTAPSAVVPLTGPVALQITAPEPKQVTEALRQYVHWNGESQGLRTASLGAIPAYRSATISLFSPPTRATRRRWVSVPMLSGSTSYYRLVPSLQTLRQGERGHVDLQLYGFDREWYSLTDRPEVHFRVARGTELLTSTPEAGTYIAVPNRRVSAPYEEVVIEATLASSGNQFPVARARVLVIPEGRLR